MLSTDISHHLTVTGATGGMGLALVEAILECGADVVGLDRVDKPATEAWGNVELVNEITLGFLNECCLYHRKAARFSLR